MNWTTLIRRPLTWEFLGERETSSLPCEGEGVGSVVRCGIVLRLGVPGF